jgi:hypothetical protein
MVDPTTVNKFLNQPSTNTDLGTWGVPINSNMDIIDAAFGGVATVTISSQSTVLSSAQYQSAFIRLTGAMSANINISFPSIGSFYTIINDTTNSSAFYITASTTIGGGQVIGLPTHATTDVWTSSANVRFRGLPHVGAYWDYIGGSAPLWLGVCTIPPWIYCNGTTFSSATYPALATILGGNTLPDCRGRQSYNLNDGTGRITSAGGIDGNTRFAGGGTQTTTISTLNLPAINPFPMIDGPHTHSVAFSNAQTGNQIYTTFSNPTGGPNGGATITIFPSGIGITVFSGGSNSNFAVTPPGVVSGIRFIRAA